MNAKELKSRKEIPFLLRPVEARPSSESGETSIRGILQYKTVILVSINANFIDKNVWTGL